MIPFNKPYLTGKEVHYIYQSVYSGQISGNGLFTKKCQIFFEERYGFKKALLVTSCTDALEMCALLLNIQPGDEIIMPSFTFVSTAVAFVRQGAKIIFADSKPNHPGINEDKIEELITPKTKVIVPVHYAGVACDMDKIMALADKYNLFVVEDAAQSIDSYYKAKPLGSIGHLGCFSFHETKNIQCGEGGMLTINDERFIKRAEIIWEKGTNRAQFFRGEINKYGWMDIGSSFLPSDIIAAFLFAQLENLEKIQKKRKKIWEQYYEGIKPLQDKGFFKLLPIPEYATNNWHMFYLVCRNEKERNELISYLKQNGVYAVFHYFSLHKSPYYKDKHDGRELPDSDMFSDCLVRLPFYYEMQSDDINKIINSLNEYVRLK
jgi:dTDP-4-amino-4,6-dideoxygalactose transaminase